MDTTKGKILSAAADLFAEKGFAGTSISDVAKRAGINQSLIYHHIGNKQALWLEAKNYLLGDYLAELDVKAFKDLRAFAKYIIDQRIELYASDPRIGRLVRWQMLEDSARELHSSRELQGVCCGKGHPVMELWASVMEHLQNTGKVTKKYPANLICIYIYSALSAVIIDYLNYFADHAEEKKTYIEMLLDTVCAGFEEK